MSPTTIAWLNALDHATAVAELARCCGAKGWRERVAAGRPYADAAALDAASERALGALADADWLEAFACHPRIGDLESLKMRYAGNRDWSAGEQAGAAAADDATLRALAAGNEAYFARFGWNFIVCATGKSAAEMLALLRARLDNDPAQEILVAAAEQIKITRLRLAKLAPSPPS